MKRMEYEGFTEDGLTQELRKIFQESARGMVEQMDSALHGAPPDADAIHLVYRVSHSLKGSSLQLGFRDFGRIATGMEALAAKLEAAGPPSRPDLEALTDAAECLKRLIDAFEHETPGEDPDAICRRLKALAG
jgi:chemotaxis protein histidine kinase CheA